jgi:hypothetical protein
VETGKNMGGTSRASRGLGRDAGGHVMIGWNWSIVFTFTVNRGTVLLLLHHTSSSHRDIARRASLRSNNDFGDTD